MKVNEMALSYRYQLLDRMRSDCEYCINTGARRFWSCSAVEQIKNMKELFNSFSDEEKPQWITLEDIEQYEKELLA